MKDSGGCSIVVDWAITTLMLIPRGLLLTAEGRRHEQPSSVRTQNHCPINLSTTEHPPAKMRVAVDVIKFMHETFNMILMTF